MTQELMSHEFDQCIKCGLCLAACPVYQELRLEKYTPRGKIQLARHHSQGKLEPSDHAREIFSKCLLCGACSVTCPSGVDLGKVFVGARERIASRLGPHPKMAGAAESIHRNRNISGEDNDERLEWQEMMEEGASRLSVKPQAEVAYFVGCVASFFPTVQSVPRNLVHIMGSARVDPALLAGEEWCCGFPLVAAGQPDKMDELKEHNLKQMASLGVKQVVFSCPSCLHTWRKYYETELVLHHSTEFIVSLIQEGRIHLGELPLSVTYHDPCDLGRHSGVFDAPREILRAIPGLSLVELEKGRAESVCCGGGGSVEMADARLSATVAQRKLEEIQRTGVRTVVTSCQQCVRTIQGQARRNRIDVDVREITDLVLEAMNSR